MGTKTMTPAMQVKLINRLIPATGNLEENLRVILGMGYQEADFAMLLGGGTLSAWHGIIDPRDGSAHEIRYATIAISTVSEHGKAVVTIDGKTVGEYFEDLASDAVAVLLPRELLEDNKDLRRSLREARERIGVLEEEIEGYRRVLGESARAC